MKSSKMKMLSGEKSLGCRGVWGKAKTLEECRYALKETLEEWIIFRLKNNLELPVIAEIDLNRLAVAA